MTGRWRQYGILFSLWGVTTAASGYTIVPASVLSVAMDRLVVGEVAASWLVSVVYLGMFLLAIPVGLVLDRVDLRRGVGTLTLGLAVAAAGSWWAADAGAYWPLVATRFVAGVLIVGAWTASVDAVGAVFGPERQATAIGVLSTAVVAGFTAGQFLGPRIVTALDWPAVFSAFGAAVVASLAVFWVASRGVAFGDVDAEPPDPGAFAEVLTSRAVWGVALLACATFSLNLVLNNWLPTYLTDRFALSLEGGGLFAALFPAIGVVGRGASGPVSDRVFGGRRRPVVLGAFLVVAPAVVAMGLFDRLGAVLVLLVLSGFALQVGLAILYTYVRELVDDAVASTALAVLNAAGFFGAFAAPVVAGVVVERTGSFPALFAFAGGIALVGAAVAWRVPEVS